MKHFLIKNSSLWSSQKALEGAQKQIWEEIKLIREEMIQLRVDVSSDIRNAEIQIIGSLHCMIKDKIKKLSKGSLSSQEREWAENVLKETASAINPVEAIKTILKRLDNLEHFKDNVTAAGK